MRYRQGAFSARMGRGRSGLRYSRGRRQCFTRPLHPGSTGQELRARWVMDGRSTLEFARWLVPSAEVLVNTPRTFASMRLALIPALRANPGCRLDVGGLVPHCQKRRRRGRSVPPWPSCHAHPLRRLPGGMSFFLRPADGLSGRSAASPASRQRCGLIRHTNR